MKYCNNFPNSIRPYMERWLHSFSCYRMRHIFLGGQTLIIHGNYVICCSFTMYSRCGCYSESRESLQVAGQLSVIFKSLISVNENEVPCLKVLCELTSSLLSHTIPSTPMDEYQSEWSAFIGFLFNDVLLIFTVKNRFFCHTSLKATWSEPIVHGIF